MSKPDTSFCERIAFLVDKYAEGNVSEFARQTDLPRRTVQKIVEKSVTNPGVLFVAAVLRPYPEEDARWLLTGRSLYPQANQRDVEQLASEVFKRVAGELARGRMRAG